LKGRMGVTAARFFSLLFARVGFGSRPCAPVRIAQQDRLVSPRLPDCSTDIYGLGLTRDCGARRATLDVDCHDPRPQTARGIRLKLARISLHRRNSGRFLDVYISRHQQTSNWTMLPETWETLRMQWEYSHAASAVLNLIAFIALAFSVSKDK
jgi:hypothetical protein